MHDATTPFQQLSEPHLTTIEVDGRRYDVSVEVAHDGIEYVGHLWFTDEAWAEDEGVRDHGALPGRRIEEVIAHAQSLSDPELVQRYRRAVQEKRRFHGLRRVTREILASVCHLNQVATSMRAGLLDVEEAAAEIDLTERKLHEMIDRLRTVAGVENAA
jgi:hypothetical protein